LDEKNQPWMNWMINIDIQNEGTPEIKKDVQKRN
jgi:hypothetical protein